MRVTNITFGLFCSLPDLMTGDGNLHALVLLCLARSRLAAESARPAQNPLGRSRHGGEAFPFLVTLLLTAVRIACECS